MAKDYEFKIDTRNFKNKINKIQNGFPDFTNTILKKIGLILLAKVKRLTPVDTGLLRRSWFLESPKNNSIEIKNNIKYGPYQEYGHKTRGGGFVAGKFMLKKSFNEISQQAPQILDTEIQKFINK